MPLSYYTVSLTHLLLLFVERINDDNDDDDSDDIGVSVELARRKTRKFSSEPRVPCRFV